VAPQPAMHMVPVTPSHKPGSSAAGSCDRVSNVDVQSPNVLEVLYAIGVPQR
jgi:hypothetical protein